MEVEWGDTHVIYNHLKVINRFVMWKEFYFLIKLFREVLMKQLNLFSYVFINKMRIGFQWRGSDADVIYNFFFFINYYLFFLYSYMHSFVHSFI